MAEEQNPAADDGKITLTDSDQEEAQLRRIWEEEARRTDESTGSDPGAGGGDSRDAGGAGGAAAADGGATNPPAGTPAATPPKGQAADPVIPSGTPKPVEQMTQAELAAELKAQRQRAEQLQHEVRSVNGRFGPLQRDLKAMRDQLAALQRAQTAQPASTPQPTPATAPAAPKTPEEWEALAQDFPDVARGVEALVNARLKAQQPAATPAQPAIDPKQLVDTAVAQATATIDQVYADRQVARFHPDWKQTVQSADFQAWRDGLDGDAKLRIEQLAASDDPLDAVRCIDYFKGVTRDWGSGGEVAHVAPTPRQTNAQRLARAAAASRPGGGMRQPELPIPDEMKTPQQIWAEENARYERERAAGLR